MSGQVLLAPLSGWCMPLEEVPDEVFAGRMMGDGLAIDPTGATLLAPCDGELTALPETAHAVTILAANGAELLLHVGIDTVALDGAGFEPLARRGQHVRAGDPLVRFDLDRLARRAKSLVTPVIVTEPGRFSIIARHAPGRISAGDPLMTLRPVTAAAPPASTGSSTGTQVIRTLAVPLPHGLHARPAAMLVQSLRNLQAEAIVSLRDRTADARSAVALLSLGARHGDRLTLRATGKDAALVHDALAAAFARAVAASQEVPAYRPVAMTCGVLAPGSFAGVGASGGLALGRATRLERVSPEVVEQGTGSRQELAALDAARERLRRRLSRIAKAGGARAGIVGAHLEFLDDPELLAAAHAAIAAGKSAGFAWRGAIRQAVGALEGIKDSRLAARADDLRDLELQLLEILGGAAETAVASLPERAILLARDLLPSQLLPLDASHIAGICTVSGAATSHVAIIAAAMELPMLTGVDAAILTTPQGTLLLLDADRGHLIIDPDGEAVADAERRIQSTIAERSRLLAAAHEPGRTADGVHIAVLANVGSTAEAAAAIAAGAEGCGLLRTELLFLDRTEPPATAEQARHYQAIVEAFDGRPVVIRTLDAGADKPIAFLEMPSEDNPALGLRGIRASLWRPELLRAQIDAIRAVQPAGRCRVLLPMVNDVAEILAVRRMLDEHGEGTCAPVALGIMIETPAAAIGARRLAAHADFFSIGTNDLAQYVLAIDRAHPLLAPQLDALHPSVLRLIGEVCAAAGGANRPVAVCGGLASDPAACALLVGLGAGELSVVPAAIPRIKDALRRRTLAECHELARRALEMESAQAVRELLAAAGCGTKP